MSTQDIISGHYAGPHSSLSDEELLSELEHITAIRDGFSETLGRLEQEAFRRMEERGAKASRPSITSARSRISRTMINLPSLR